MHKSMLTCLWLCFVLACEFSETCDWYDFEVAGNYEARELLGKWHMVAHLVPSGIDAFSEYLAQYLYVHDHKMEFVFTGTHM